MNIGIEAQRIFRKEKHGMDMVALETIRELQKIDHANEFYIFVAPGPDHCLNETDNFHIVEINCPTYPIWEQIMLPITARKYKIDLLHCTSNTAPIHCFGIPTIVTLHDIIFLEPKRGKNTSIYQNLGRVYRRLVVPRILKKATKIITISDSEKEVIKNRMDLPDEKLTTIYNGVHSRFRRIKDDDAQDIIHKYYNGKKKYILTFGNSDPRKNTIGSVASWYRYYKASAVKSPLLIIGCNASDLSRIITATDVDKHAAQFINHTGYVPDDDLTFIYNGASIVLFLSHREGFGLPILESMACGVPVITGNSSAMPEIAGEDGITIDVNDYDTAASMMIKLETDRVFYKKQVEYGMKRALEFGWDKTAQKLMNVYDTLTHK